MRTGLITICILLGVMVAVSSPVVADTEMEYSIMQPDEDTIARWVGDYLTSDELRLEGGTARGSVNLLPHLDYVTADRNQASCGNCWAWAGTGCMEIAHDIDYGVFDRLSVQYLNSCYNGGAGGGYACCGGWLSDFVGYYNGTTIAVPWSNTDANWQDGGTGCGGSTTVTCGDIATTPNYGITSIGMYRIPTQGETQADAIANIKAALNGDQAVWFAFFLPDFGPFFSFWSGAGASETDVWSFDYSCGTTYEGDNKGGHAILCVGYNDDDPENSYWIMVNSWGTGGGARPNGILRVDMDMDYSCSLPGLGAENGSYSLYWQTLSVTFGNIQPICDCNGPYSAECTGTTTQVQLDGSASIDPDQDELSFAWTSDCPGASFDDSTSETPWLTVDSVSPCPLECNVTLTVTDEGELSDACSTTVTISDTTAPGITVEADDQTVECDGVGNTDALTGWLSTHGGAAAIDSCGEITWSDDFPVPGLSNGCCETGSATVTFTATDDCGLSAGTTATFTIEDTTPPSIDTPASDLTVECDGAGNVDELNAWLGSHGGAVASDVCCGDDITWTNNFAGLSDGCCETGSATVTFTATDGCNNPSTTTATFTIVDNTPPEIFCPDDITLERGDKLCNSDVQDWLDSTTATDICCDGEDEITIVDDSAANGYECGFPYDSTTEVTWTATDDCGNSSECSAFITIKKAPRVDMTRKGSLLIFSKVELRWNASGELIQDTFLDLSNDYPGWVAVQMYFFNGDPPTEVTPNDRAHLGWNWVDNFITLTGDQPAYWSAATGAPKGVSPFTVLDPSADPLLQGRPCCDGTGERMLRGMVLAWAVNPVGEEIRWNHLKGDALIVNYGKYAAWEYGAWAFSTRCLTQGEQPLDCVEFDANGVCCNADVIPGNLDLDAFQYDLSFDELILDFYAPGLGYPGAVETIDGDLTLFPAELDLRQETTGPVTTKAKFDIWNMNEVKFSNTERCITCWDQELLSMYDAPNSFLREHLQTNKGKARIDGMQSMLCEDSVDASLLGVSMKMLGFNAGVDLGLAGNNLFGSGYQSGRIQYDPSDEPPPELALPVQPVKLSPEVGSVGVMGKDTVKAGR